MNLRFKGWATGVVLFFSFIFFSCTGLFAQGFQATLDGQVIDSAGAAVTGAKITVKEINTGTTTIGISGDDGYYHVGSLNAGQYSIVVEKPSFDTIIRDGVVLEVLQHATVNFKLAPGHVSQSVTVTAQAAQLQTVTPDQGVVVDQARMLAMPTQGHSPFSGVFSVPGVVVISAAQRSRAFDTGGASDIGMNGSPSSTNEVLVDGLTALNQAQGVGFIPTVEATSELKVQTTTFDAQYGWTLGGITNMVSRAGTNDFHGAVWEYFQNTVLDANNFNGNNTVPKTPRTTSHINTFGGTFSGPILKNKLFFAYTFEDLRQVIPDPFVTSVPTALQKTGDFSQTFTGPGQLDVIYNPFSTVTNPDGTSTRTAFMGNKIPPGMLDPVAVKVLSYIPLGNTAGDPVTGLNNLSNHPGSRKFTDYFPENTIRVDYNVNPSTRFFVRYSRNALSEERSFRYSTTTTTNPADTSGNNPFTRENHNAVGQLTKILNPNTVLTVRTGLERFRSEGGSQQGAGHGPGTLGFSSTYAGQAGNWFPQFNWTNYNGAGAQPTGVTTSYNYVLQASLAKSMGPYNLNVGVDLRLLRSNEVQPGYIAGQFSFDQQFTGENPLQIEPTSGNAIASFLMGTPASGSIQIEAEPARQEKQVSVYMQNDIHVSNRLTLNLGLRWDYMGPMTDRFNGLATFNPEVVNPLQVPGQTLYGGLVFAGVNGNRRAVQNQSWGNFGPRAGVSYLLNHNTVVHGGYALVYGQTWNDPGEPPGFSQTTSMVSTLGGGVPFNTLDNPFPTGILHPTGSSLGLRTALGEGISFADPDGRPPLVQQISIGIEHQLPRNFLLSASYAGTRFARLPVTQNLDALPLSAIGLGAVALQQQVLNPFAGLIPGSGLNNATVARQQLLLPYPQFTGVSEQFRPIGTSSYNGAKFVVSKRLSHGLDFVVGYTISKQLDQKIFANPQDTHLEKVIAAWDTPQELQINLLWQLPFGTGRAFGANLPKPVRAAISGWDFSAITLLRSGTPLDLSNASNSVPIGNPALSNPSLHRWFNTCTLLASGLTQNCVGSEQPVWAVRPADTLQTWKTRLTSVRLPGIHNTDISLMKNNQITQRINLIFRTDFINAFNSPQFYNGPSADVNNPNFGKIAGATDQSNLPRFIQFSMKMQF